MKQLVNVLVILASYNGEKWIEEQVLTIVNQCNVKVHIHISDDLSNDATVEKINLLRTKYSNIEIKIAKERSGSAGLNFIRTFQHVNTDGYHYIAISDQDDVWKKNKIAAGVASLESSGSSGYSSSVISFWEDEKQMILNQSGKIKALDFLFEGAGQGCTFLIRQEVFVRIQTFIRNNYGLVSGFYYHDWLVYLLIRSWGLGWNFDQVPTMYYRQHNQNDTGSRGTFNSVLKRYKLIKDGWYKNQIILAIEIFKASGNISISQFDRFEYLMKSQDSFYRKVMLSYYLYKTGRRKLLDRIVMVVATILGYL
jgi:rhamnosyltransferase